jgi:hypothetical protein
MPGFQAPQAAEADPFAPTKASTTAAELSDLLGGL